MDKIIIVDDNYLLLDNIRQRLTDHFQILLAANSAQQSFQFIETHIAEDWPAIVLMDIEMEEMDGIRATSYIKQNFPNIKVAMLTVFEEEEKVWQSILAGADGYILKDESKEKLISAVSDILQGGAYMSASIALKAMQLLKKTYAAPDQKNIFLNLTNRESEILELIANGYSYRQIADKIFISVFTAKTHIHNIYEKLQVKNKTEAAMKLRQISFK